MLPTCFRLSATSVLRRRARSDGRKDAMTGAQYIAEFLSRVGSDRVFLLTGGACAFMIDAVAQHPGMHYTCFQHEQAAAMAADALWRVSRKVGVSIATSGPGATNLITGIASSYFDS